MANAAKLVGTGIAMGVVHVLTGPDHISALATLSSLSASSSESSTPSKCYLFGLGARWGIGHGAGLLLVGGIFLVRDLAKPSGSDGNDEEAVLEIPPSVTRVLEAFVGVFLLLLGCHGIFEARRIRYGGSGGNFSSPLDGRGDENNAEERKGVVSTNYSDEPDDNANGKGRGFREIAPFEVETQGDGGDGDKRGETKSSGFDGFRDTNDGLEGNDNDMEEFRYNIQLMLGTVSTPEEETEGNDGSSGRSSNLYHHHHDADHSNSPCLALCTGVFHGLAGPGGVLGVVPALQLHDPGLAFCYLASFCASSTLTMGTFASAYGTVVTTLASACGTQHPRYEGLGTPGAERNEGLGSSDRTAVVEFWIRCASASLSILVGTVWLLLLAMGKLKDVFEH